MLLVNTLNLVGTKDVHEWDGSRDGLEGEEGSHGDHSSPSVLDFNSLVTLVLLGGKLLLESEVVEVQVTGGLGGLSSEVVSGVANTLTLTDGDDEEDGSEDFWALGGENSEGLGPVSLNRGAGEVHAEAHTILKGKKAE
jgi:hypothetical protein